MLYIAIRLFVVKNPHLKGNSKFYYLLKDKLYDLIACVVGCVDIWSARKCATCI